ncbi:hypothetical protein LINGRAHAP2_LOCUS28952, partial [Linum grandiflorum]
APSITAATFEHSSISNEPLPVILLASVSASAHSSLPDTTMLEIPSSQFSTTVVSSITPVLNSASTSSNTNQLALNTQASLPSRFPGNLPIPTTLKKTGNQSDR